jgi:hypothetical protein
LERPLELRELGIDDDFPSASVARAPGRRG